MAVANVRSALDLTPAERAINLALAAGIVGSWLVLHVSSIFFIDWWGSGLWPLIPLVVLAQTWLSVGMFIVAHDAMHGSLVPGNAAVNTLIGRICVGLYAGFSWDKLYANHHAHHRHAGTEHDPDFDADHPSEFWPWYYRFFRTYFGWREFGLLTIAVVVYCLILWQRWPNVLLFWAAPAILSSLQLFYFGTYRPHRIEEGEVFSDRHNSRSNEFPWLISLLTCFHFGYHHEHHDRPWVPWWKLPKVRDAGLAGHRMPTA
jgi:beta-carotene ketolase (CrtW type)